MSTKSSRVAYIDWLRGLACVLMFQTHCYDAWLGGTARNSKFFMWSQMLGTFPAPLFLFLAGISFAMVVDKLLEKNATPNQIARKTIWRGAEILALGFLFRVQEFVIAWGWAPRSDLFRVDILNCIGVSLMLMGAICWVALVVKDSRIGAALQVSPTGTGMHAGADRAGVETRPYTSLIVTALVVTAAISLLTPLAWTTWRPDFLPWQLETYINGVHNLGQPQPWLFPIFPWAAFAFAGLALGFLLMNERARKAGAHVFFFIGCAGLALIFFSKILDSSRLQIYSTYDYWHTSPEFFIARNGFLFLFVLFAYAWCRWGLGQWGFSPLIQLGKTSLLVYWVHIEFVYGRFSILPRKANSIVQASAGLLIIFLAMLALSLLRTSFRGMKFYPARVRPSHS